MFSKMLNQRTDLDNHTPPLFHIWTSVLFHLHFWIFLDVEGLRYLGGLMLILEGTVSVSILVVQNATFTNLHLSTPAQKLF
jgi:hypothetical protein